MSIEAFILVGGRSSRLGRDKAFELVGGKTLAERALGTVRDSGVASKIFFVTGNEVDFAIEAARLDTLFVFDLIEGRGPLGGLYTALTNATAEWIFVLACDLPFVSSQLIVDLSSYTHGQQKDFGVIVPEQPDGRLQPLCALYNVERVKPIVDEMIHRPRVSPSMREVVAALHPLIVKPIEYEPVTGSQASYFANINSEQDLEAAREIERKLSGGGEI